jgi:hypothetical protein
MSAEFPGIEWVYYNVSNNSDRFHVSKLDV